MVHADAQRFAAILNGLAAVKPGKELTREGLAIWWDAMSDWSIEDFAKAANHLARSLEFMPSPFHFEQLKNAGQKTSGEAWSIALARSVLWRNGQRWNDRIERAARAVGGWQTIAMADTETALPHLERRFKTAYDELTDVEETRAALPNIAADPDAPRLEDQTRPARLTRGA